MSGLAQLVSDIKEPESLKYVEESLEQRGDPLQLLEEAKHGISVVGQKFARGECFIPDLVFSGEILKGLVKVLEPHLKKEEEW